MLHTLDFKKRAKARVLRAVTCARARVATLQTRRASRRRRCNSSDTHNQRRPTVAATAAAATANCQLASRELCVINISRARRTRARARQRLQAVANFADDAKNSWIAGASMSGRRESPTIVGSNCAFGQHSRPSYSLTASARARVPTSSNAAPSATIDRRRHRLGCCRRSRGKALARLSFVHFVIVRVAQIGAYKQNACEQSMQAAPHVAAAAMAAGGGGDGRRRRVNINYSL